MNTSDGCRFPTPRLLFAYKGAVTQLSVGLHTDQNSNLSQSPLLLMQNVYWTLIYERVINVSFCTRFCKVCEEFWPDFRAFCPCLCVYRLQESWHWILVHPNYYKITLKHLWFSFLVVQSASAGYDLTCGIRCNFLWDGFGNWGSGNQGALRWKPFVTADGELRSVKFYDFMFWRRVSLKQKQNKKTLFSVGLRYQIKRQVTRNPKYF